MDTYPLHGAIGTLSMEITMAKVTTRKASAKSATALKSGVVSIATDSAVKPMTHEQAKALADKAIADNNDAMHKDGTAAQRMSAAVMAQWDITRAKEAQRVPPVELPELVNIDTTELRRKALGYLYFELLNEKPVQADFKSDDLFRTAENERINAEKLVGRGLNLAVAMAKRQKTLANFNFQTGQWYVFVTDFLAPNQSVTEYTPTTPVLLDGRAYNVKEARPDPKAEPMFKRITATVKTLEDSTKVQASRDTNSAGNVTAKSSAETIATRIPLVKLVDAIHELLKPGSKIAYTDPSEYGNDEAWERLIEVSEMLSDYREKRSKAA